MKLKRITRLRHRVFRDFTWPNELPDFARFNVVYGWNGSGKTTLSSLLAHVATRTPLTEGEAELELDDGRRCTGARFDDPTLPQVRVFDRDFIRTTLASTGGIAPIYFLGEDSLEKQNEVERLRSELAAAYVAVTDATNEKKRAEDSLDELCVAQAKIIKGVLTSANSAAYNNYDKRKFRQAALSMTPERASASVLTDEQKTLRRTQKDAQPKATLESLRAPSVDLDALTREVESLVDRSVVAQTLDELTADPNLASWVQRGLTLHSAPGHGGPHESDTCRFCAQPLRPKRRAALEAHFNDAFAGHQKELSALATKLHAARQTLGSLRLPEPTRFYETLAADVTAANEDIARALGATMSALDRLLERVEHKRANPFSPVEASRTPTAPWASVREAIAPLHGLIEQHNQTSNRFQASVDEAARDLEASYVAEAYGDFAQRTDAVKRADESLQSLRARPPVLQARIDELERAILEHRRPADELTEELRTYLGRDELRFAVKGNGYALTRNGQPVSNLSEGERTAIAFLYFLKSLEDKTFDVSKGIVVIDDPVSSLDANALFSAFAYLRERTKRCGQLILLTHDFAFFRLVKSWFQHLPGQRSKYPAKRPARFFQLRTRRLEDGSRSSAIGPLDPLLEQHESEYQYLFKRIYEEANRSDVPSMEQHYGLPTLARRLLEAFLAFRFPELAGDDLDQRLDRVVTQYAFDDAKRSRIARLLYAGSHGDAITDPDHDLSLLAETQPILIDVLDLMETVDVAHYEGLKKLLSRSESTEEESDRESRPR